MNRKIIAAGGLVLNENNELLMIFRRSKWDLPKGKLDEGESIEECALREVKEETGLTHLQLKELIGITEHEYHDEHTHKDVIKETHWYKMISPNGEKLIPQTEEGIEAIEWVNNKNLAEKLQDTFPNIIEIICKLKPVDC